MGLFRRGTKLLRLGSGLRDCCCRPENPEECFCPDVCRYYFRYGGDNVFSEKTLIEPACLSPNQEQEREDVFEGFSPLQGTNPVTGNVEEGFSSYTLGAQKISQGGDSGCVGPQFERTHTHLVAAVDNEYTRSVLESFAFIAPQIRYGQNITARVKPSPASSWAVDFFIGSRVTLQTLFGYAVVVFDERRFVSIDVPATCQKNILFQCDIEPLVSRSHLNQDAAFAISGEGVTFDGVLHAWGIDIVVQNGTDWEVAGEYPFDKALSLTLKGLNSCQPGDCDCELDLTGRTVVFEGQTFTYGSGQTFNSGDGLTVWEESPTGTFRKIIYDDCDPGQQIKTFEETAQVFCTNIDGTDFWAVQLIVQCFERDACSPPFDRSRTITWDGILECSSDGYPSGSPETELASDLPSNPAPTGTCDPIPDMPTFSFP